MELLEQQNCILVVDDDPATRDLVKRHLVDAGYDVLLAGSADEAWPLLCQQSAELVVTDWLMPGMDGLDFCRRIRAHPELGFFYVIMLTAQDARDKLVEALDAGADDYITKPFNRDELLARIRVGMRFVAMRSELTRRTSHVYRSSAELASLNTKLKSQALTDELTGLLNRRETLKQLERHWRVTEANQTPLTCIMVDIDHFKPVNDTHGHEAGDQVLTDVAALLRNSCRATDAVGRLGGEEFLIICPQTSLEHAGQLAERIRTAAEQTATLVRGSRLNVTLSLGVATRGPRMRRPEDLLRAADEALYDAKEAGRNQVCITAPDNAAVSVDDDVGIPID